MEHVQTAPANATSANSRPAPVDSAAMEQLRKQFQELDTALNRVHEANLESARELLLQRSLVLRQILASTPKTEAGLASIAKLGEETEQLSSHLLSIRQGLVLEANHFSAQKQYAGQMDTSQDESHWKTLA